MRRHLPTRILALFLTLGIGLSLPAPVLGADRGPAHALRPRGADADSVRAGLEEALQPAVPAASAGLEEEGSPVEQLEVPLEQQRDETLSELGILQGFLARYMEGLPNPSPARREITPLADEAASQRRVLERLSITDAERATEFLRRAQADVMSGWLTINGLRFKRRRLEEELKDAERERLFIFAQVGSMKNGWQTAVKKLNEPGSAAGAEEIQPVSVNGIEMWRELSQAARDGLREIGDDDRPPVAREKWTSEEDFERFLNRHPSGGILYARQGDKVVGFVAYEGTFTVHIHNLGVRQEAHPEDVLKVLLDEMNQRFLDTPQKQIVIPVREETYNLATVMPALRDAANALGMEVRRPVSVRGLFASSPFGPSLDESPVSGDAILMNLRNRGARSKKTSGLEELPGQRVERGTKLEVGGLLIYLGSRGRDPELLHIRKTGHSTTLGPMHPSVYVEEVTPGRSGLARLMPQWLDQEFMNTPAPLPPRYMYVPPGYNLGEVIQQLSGAGRWKGGLSAADMGRIQAVFNELLDRSEVQQQLADRHWISLDSEQARGFGFQAAGGFLVADEASLESGDHMVVSDNQLRNEAVSRLLSWVQAGENIPEVIRAAAEMGMADGVGHVIALEAEPGVTREMIEQLLAGSGLAGRNAAQAVVGSPTQIEALPILAFELLSKKKGLPPVVVLSVAVRLQDKAGNTYTLILMA